MHAKTVYNLLVQQIIKSDQGFVTTAVFLMHLDRPTETISRFRKQLSFDEELQGPKSDFVSIFPHRFNTNKNEKGPYSKVPLYHLMACQSEYSPQR